MACDQLWRFGFLVFLVVFGKVLSGGDDKELESDAMPEERNVTAFCLVKAETGDCRGSFLSWAYDAESQTCSEFTYGGCGGNNNRYSDEKECLQSCQGVTGSGNLSDASGISKRMTNFEAAQKSDNLLEDDGLAEFCTVPFEVGPCRAALPRWHYSPEKKTCVQAIYGGCKGNKNNYMTEEDCMTKCSAFSPEPFKQEEDDQFDYQENCAASKVVGPCRASFPRWYFNAEIRKCEEFTYGGCKGNKNNYMSRELCMEKCSEANTNFDPVASQFFHHSRTTMILAGVLGVLALILVTSMICFFVRLAKKTRTTTVAAIWVPTDDKECLMNSAYTL